MIIDTKAFCEENYEGCQVIYGDTDSVMVKFETWPTNERVPGVLRAQIEGMQEDGASTCTIHMQSPVSEILPGDLGKDYILTIQVRGEKRVLRSCAVAGSNCIQGTAKGFAKESLPMDIPDNAVALFASTIIHPTMDGMRQAFDAGTHAAKAVTEILFNRYPAKILEHEKAMLGAVYFPEKKKYAQRCYEEKYGKPKMDVKGLPIVRRDNSEWMRDTLKAATGAALPMEGPPLTHEEAARRYIAKIKEALDDLVHRRVPLEKFCISKSLKIYSEYKNPDSMGHVVLWRKILSRIDSGEIVQAPPRAGDRIEYVVVEGKGKQFNRCEDIDWVKAKKLKIDRLYYARILMKPAEDFVRVIGYSVKTIFSEAFTDINNQTTGVQKLSKFFSVAPAASQSAKESKLEKRVVKKKRKAGTPGLGSAKLTSFFTMSSGSSSVGGKRRHENNPQDSSPARSGTKKNKHQSSGSRPSSLQRFLL